MPDASAFSPDYIAARARFRAGAMRLGCELERHTYGELGPDGEELTVDVARLGSARARRLVVVSSGLHGVEGFLGSAVQAAVLEEAIGAWRPPEDAALLLLHGLNPWGMAWGRRVNEDNVDLNRNFLLPDQSWRGLPDGYVQIDKLLHPHTAPARFDTFLPRATWLTLSHGAAFLQGTAAAGQYDRPRGLFFGGNGASRTSVLLQEHMPRWAGGTERIVHLDLHSGVGPWGRYLLLSTHKAGTEQHEQLVRAFGADVVVPEPDDGVRARGELVPWLGRLLGEDRYEGLTAEFGTVGPLRLLAAMRAENQAHHHGEPEHLLTERAHERLLRALNPIDRRWRNKVVPQGVRLVQRALEVTLGASVAMSASA